jgi:hypothetical protein
MLRFFVLLVALCSAFSFNPMGMSRYSKVQMNAEKSSPAKVLGAAIAATLLVGSPVFAKDGEGAKLSFFGNAGYSSPFVEEQREDPIYSPYSPYGNGEKSAYKLSREGSADELKFWRSKFEASS